MQSFEENKSEYPTGNLATIFHKPVEEANPYVQFVYVPQKICNHTRGQVSGSMNSDPIKTGQKPTTQIR